MINLILFGQPGSGKGTQAAKLVEKYNLLHISTGDLFRYEIGNSTPLGLEAKSYMDKGMLVPDSVTIGMLRNKVESNKLASGYIFDGFPRTIPQCEALDQLLAEKESHINLLIKLDVPDEEVVRRLLVRGKTSGRPDDNDETIIRHRMVVYKQETSSVFGYYQEHDCAIEISGVGEIADIFQIICTEIEKTLEG